MDASQSGHSFERQQSPLYLPDISETTTNPSSSANFIPSSRMPAVDSVQEKMFETNIDEPKTEGKTQSQNPDDQRKSNHSEVEKRRREKMNTCIKELSCIIPSCSKMSRKLDKLTILRMAVHHVKEIKGDMVVESPESRPSFLTDKKLFDLIMKVAEGFLFTISCDEGKILFITECVRHVLSYERGQLVGQTIFEILHPNDVEKVKEQLKPMVAKQDSGQTDDVPQTKLTSSISTSKPISGQDTPFSWGSRRSFLCRMRCSQLYPDISVKEADKKRKNSTENKYIVIHCLGYIKSCPQGTEQVPCLVAVGKTIPCPTVSDSKDSQKMIPTEPIHYISRHSMDGKFTFIDQRAVFILGFLPQELLGTSAYEYCHPDDVKFLADSHRKSLESETDVTSKPYRFKTKSGSYVNIQTKWTNFRNPCTNDFEYLIARHTCLSSPCHRERRSSHSNASELENKSVKSTPKSNPSENLVKTTTKTAGKKESRVRKMLSSFKVNMWKIGKQISEETMNTKMTESCSSEVPSQVKTNFTFPSSLQESNTESNGQGSSRATVGAKESLHSSPGSGQGNGSDSDNSSSIYSINTFYRGSNNYNHESSIIVPSSASSMASHFTQTSTSCIVNSQEINSTGDHLLTSTPESNEKGSQELVEETASASGGQAIDEAAMSFILSLLESDERRSRETEGLYWSSF